MIVEEYLLKIFTHHIDYLMKYCIILFKMISSKTPSPYKKPH